MSRGARSRDAHGIELDVCSDHGTWFDARELAHLVAALRGEPVPAVSKGRPGDIRCGGCGLTMRSDHANLTEDGLRCERCWRKPDEAYAAAVAQAARDDAAGKAALIGVAAALLGAAVSSRGS